jgi:hypothetical protein
MADDTNQVVKEGVEAIRRLEKRGLLASMIRDLRIGKREALFSAVRDDSEFVCDCAPDDFF